VDDLTAQFHRFEVALARRDPEGIEGGLMALIDDDFMEYGASGRVWDREGIRELLDGPAGPPIELADTRVVPLAEHVVLVTYQAAGVNRSSVWVRRDGRWRMRFHQGTRRLAGT
jgi:glyoxylase I family protein